MCCRGFKVPLKMDEYVKIASQFGYDAVELDVGKVYLQRGANDRCIFQRYWDGKWLCMLQAIKPIACKLFPFRVQREPKYPGGGSAYFNYRGTALYVYLDPHCPRIRLGTPSRDFTNKVLPEFVEIGLGVRTKQYYSTSQKIASSFRI
jgi:Fe-S-cluster containining protein